VRCKQNVEEEPINPHFARNDTKKEPFSTILRQPLPLPEAKVEVVGEKDAGQAPHINSSFFIFH
jgi:hypothetical protein